MGLVISKGLTLRKGYIPIDTDAANYAMRVEAADGEPLEDAVFSAINSFVLGCKQDGIWNAIKASCILAGARTLSGALVPLVGTAPTNFNFVSGDYNRKTGLVGDGSTKYLDSNRNDTSEPIASVHLSAYSSSPSPVNSFIAARFNGSYNGSNTDLFVSGSNMVTRINSSGLIETPYGLGFSGSSRNESQLQVRSSSVTISTTNNFVSQQNANYTIFARRVVFNYTDARLAFYSIGESLNLALLDARVTDLINAFAAAIP
jgi:hypothetical protein